MMNNTMTLRASLSVLVLCFALGACGGGGGGGSSNPPQNPPNNPPNNPPTLPDPSTAPALKDEFTLFQIGAAIEPEQLDIPADRALLLKHYNTLTAENAMKADTIAPDDPSLGNPYNFERADAIVDFAIENGMAVHGHALVWHQTSPEWFFARPEGMDDLTYRNTVAQRLRAYVNAVVTHFKGRVTSWDVVNEVASDVDGEIFRTDSPWYQAFNVAGGEGADYIRFAFEEARQVDPDALLFINDYSTENPAKLERVLGVVDYLERSGIEVDGVGHQFHLQRNANPDHVDAALRAVEELNLRNRVTELDISIYVDPNSCFSSGIDCQADYGADFNDIPQSVVAEQAQLYRDVFEVFREHDASIDAVTTWGISDAHTWLNFWPVSRVNRPLLFDTEGNPKLAFWAVVDSTFDID